MKTAIATVCLSGNLPEKLAAIAAAGFQGIEIFENDFLTFDAPPREVGRMVRDHGLEIALYQPFRDFEGLPDGLRQRSFDRARRKFDLMAELGAELMLICSNTHPQALGGIDRAAEDLRALGDEATARGLRLGFEALAWGRHTSDHRDAWEIVRRADHAHVGLVLDSFHTLARGIDPDSIRAIPGDRIFFVQLADAPRIEMDLLYWSRHFRNMPGQGDLDVTSFMRAVAATGYSGYLSLEIFNDQFRGAAPRSIALDGQRSLRWLMDDVAQQEPGIRITPPTMPPRGRARGIEFIEFATDTGGAETLSKMLHSLGFTVEGQHLSKQVTHWRQGHAHVLINTSDEGFAHSLYLLRGTTVCDVGLQVTDAAATVARAQCLGAELIDPPVGPGELRIPAIRGAGGGLWRFIDASTGLDRLWQVDFTPATDVVTNPTAGPASGLATPGAAGITGIDHLAQTMNYEEMQSWILFYLSLLDMEKAPLVDVIDPSGLVRSQAVAAPDGALRITLNGADNSRTLAGRFLAQGFGPSVQHVALACDDIFATARALTANGFAPLVISPNYYDDLEARLDLAPDLAEQLRTHNVLYDRDDYGEFFQIYSPTLPEGFFFEIVERRGGYRGYGAANAPFRVAAQARARAPAGMPRA